ncbi:Uncharacterised protein [Escherichia coli]|nr:Uncharacterised protein [Escherichia coli]SQU05707.1 Uncharacterised protein [Escherichia coli]SQU29271.1 Uncharacterised protein [Escherichia coli]SQU30132.1 Uncharacterised protein [Escherichia coli]SQU74987.1 Uncharacterised protein [Escherichia coli]
MGFVIVGYAVISLAIALFVAVVIFYAKIWNWIFNQIARFMRKREARNALKRRR